MERRACYAKRAPAPGPATYFKVPFQLLKRCLHLRPSLSLFLLSNSKASMAIVRTRSQLFSPAPPPSPIPTGKGSRSAAVNDQILSEYLQKSLEIPDLALPKPYFQASGDHPVPAEIDYRSLVSRERDSIDPLLKSAAEFGVIRIVGHGISAEEIVSVMAEAEWMFRISEERGTKLRRNGNREEVVWFRSEKERREWERDLMETEKYRDFRRKIENVVSKLEVIAEEVGQIFSENSAKKSLNRIPQRESVLSLYRYNHDNVMDQNPASPNEKSCKSCSHGLSLHLPMKQCEFCVQSGQGTWSFGTGPETIVVTVGELLEEWSLGEFKSVCGELMFEPDLHGSQPSFSIDFKCSPLTLNHGLEKINKTISVLDQILIALFITFLYKFLLFISS